MAIVYCFVFLYFLARRRRRMEPRLIARAHILIRPIAEPGLRIIGYIMPQLGRSCAPLPPSTVGANRAALRDYPVAARSDTPYEVQTFPWSGLTP